MTFTFSAATFGRRSNGYIHFSCLWWSETRPVFLCCVVRWPGGHRSQTFSYSSSS